MKLIIQIPCFNESATLPLVFRDMPAQIAGIDEIEFQVIDDGSTDQTIRVAKSLGVHHIIQIPGQNRRWLGRAFKLGVDHALRCGADILVNTDGDNQYPSSRIPDLVRPILDGYADIVVGDRSPGHHPEFSLPKRLLQSLGNFTIEYLTGEAFKGRKVRDAVSGFRAYSREALLRLHVLTNYTYTVDSLIQAYKKGLAVEWIKINPNQKTRESRLITSLTDKVRRSGGTILRLVTVYEPFKTFLLFSSLFLIPGLILMARFAYFYFFVPGESRGHIQSVVVGCVLLVIAAQMFALGILGELLSVNRSLTEDLLTRVRRLEVAPSASSEEEKQPLSVIVNA